MRTTSMMRDGNASALTPARKSSNGVLLSRLFRTFKCGRWLWNQLAAGFEPLRGRGPLVRGGEEGMKVLADQVSGSRVATGCVQGR
jgi:hypothetical protein